MFFDFISLNQFFTTPDQFILKIKEYPEKMKIFVDIDKPIILRKTRATSFAQIFRFISSALIVAETLTENKINLTPKWRNGVL